MKYRVSLLVSGIVCIALIVSAALVYKSLNVPSHGSVAPTLKSAGPSFDLTPIPVVGKLVQFSYPRIMTAVPTEAAHFPVIESFAYTYKDVESWRLSITVNQLTGPELVNDNSYQFRATQSARYQRSTANYGSNTYVIMSDRQTGGFNTVAYTLHANHSADISLSGDDANGLQELNKVFVAVLTSWQWR